MTALRYSARLRQREMRRLILHCVSCGRRFVPIHHENICPTCEHDQ